MSFKIGELSKRSNIEVVTIRYYEKEGLLPEPERTDGNYRLYEDAQVERLRFIRHCRSLDMTLREIRVLLELRDHPQQDCSEVNDLLDENIIQVNRQIHELKSLKDHLVALREQCTGSHPTKDCGILQGLTADTTHRKLKRRS